MLVHWLVRLSALSLGLTCVVCTTPPPQQNSQLATLHERMNQMLSALYSSPLLSKVKASSSDDVTAASPESTFSFPAPAPQVVYISPPSYHEGSQPNEFAYSLASTVPRPAYSFDYYQQQFAPVYSQPRPYPEYSRYPLLPAPQPVSYPPFAPPTYPPFPLAQYPRPALLGYQPGYPAPGLPSPFVNQVPYPPMSLPGPVNLPQYPPYPAPALPAPYSSMYSSQGYPCPYSPPALPSPYTGLPQLAPSPYPPPVPLPSLPVPYFPSLSYPQPMYPSLPKPSDFLPQPQYEYSS